MKKFIVEISKDLYRIGEMEDIPYLKRAEKRYHFWKRVYIAKEHIERQLNERYGYK
jgi:hypothetical protein